MKLVTSLVILGLCANICFGAAPVSSSQSSAFSSSYLNSTIIKVISGTNSTDSAIYDASCATCGTGSAAVNGPGIQTAWFGPGATNDTSYIWGLPSATEQVSAATTGASACGTSGACHTYTTSSIRKRTINNTIVGWGNDTMEASVIGDTAITTSIMGNLGAYAAGPGYTAIVSTGLDSGAAGGNNQVWITLISGVGGSATSIKVTATADVYASSSTIPAVGTSCTYTTYSIGNVWYNWGNGVFYYTYSKNVATQPQTTNTDGAGVCHSGTPTYANTIYLGGVYANGTAYWTSPISVSAATATNGVTSLMGGVDNTQAAQNIYLTYKDTTSTVLTTYVSKTAISVNTSAIGSFNALQKDSSTGSASSSTAGTNVVMTYSPASVWSSNNTYAITLTNTTVTTVWAGSNAPYTSTVTTVYAYTNYFNGTTTGVDSGFASGSGAGNFGGFYAWQLNTGYTVVAGYESSSTPYPTTFYLGTFWANGTVNSTAVTAGTLTYGAPSFYEDVNGTQWIGWFDVDTATGNSEWIYNAYLAKFQGQLNIPSGSNILSAISFFALFLASIFIF